MSRVVSASRAHVLLIATASVTAIIAISGSANAGGFAVREQSTLHQGASFAGSAAGSSLSTMFWNSAAAAFAPSGLSTDSNYAVIIGRSDITGDAFAGAANLGLPRESGDIAKDAILPASYSAYRLNDRAVLALGINSPFGLVTEPSNRFYAGQTFAKTSDVKTYNFNPTIGYKLTPEIAVGAGVQIQYIDVRLKNATGIGVNSLNGLVSGDDIGFGFTLGVMFTPSKATSIGLGFRSAIEHTLDGHINIPKSAIPLAAAETRVKANTTLPEIVTLSMRQAIDPRLTLLGTVEWTNWSRLDKIDVVCSGAGNAVFCPAGAGQNVRSLEFGWHDSWFFSLGAEYAYSKDLMLRGGVGYELSPVQNPSERSLRVPDNDRIWVSAGASYQYSPWTTFDLAYTHVFVDDGAIDRLESGLRFVGKAETSVDIISVGVRSKLDWLIK